MTILAYCPTHRVPVYTTNKGGVACIRCEIAKRNHAPTKLEKKVAYNRDLRQRKREGRPTRRQEEAAK